MNCPNCNHLVAGNPRLCPTCGVFLPEHFVGQVFGDKYKLLDVLGTGGMGAVYRAWRQHIEDEVAVKILLPAFSLPRHAARFRREMKASARVKHPNVIVIHDWNEAIGSFPAFIVMEMVRGVVLSSLLESEQRLEWSRAVYLMIESARGVGAAHKEGIIHRDLKPSNIMVVPPRDELARETVKILDFGLAKLSDPDTTKLTRSGWQPGTPLYKSPEQARGDELQVQTDVYSLGITLYEMLSGAPPFFTDESAVFSYKLQYELPPPFASNLGVPSAIEGVVMRALDKVPSNRPSDATAFARELQLALDASSTVSPSHLNVQVLRTAIDSSISQSPTPTFEFQTIALAASGRVQKRNIGKAHYFVEKIKRGFTLEMVEIPSGSFQMGDPGSDGKDAMKASADETKDWLWGPVRSVTIPNFYMSKFPVTNAQWKRVVRLPKINWPLEHNPKFPGDDVPVTYVRWMDAVEFCARLSEATGKHYRLPSEAEWEYACRAGTTTPFAFGETITPKIVNFDKSYECDLSRQGLTYGCASPVGYYGVANAFGLYDTHGNVWEWCQDSIHGNYDNAPSDGSAWVDEEHGGRICRGGCWSSKLTECRSTSRLFANEYESNRMGFRIALTVA